MEFTDAQRLALGKRELAVRDAYLKVIAELQKDDGDEDDGMESIYDVIDLINAWVETYLGYVRENSAPNPFLSERDELVAYGAACLTYGMSLARRARPETFIEEARPGYPEATYVPIYPS